MVTLSAVAVEFLHRRGLPGLRVEEPEVGLLVPDGEGPEGGMGEEDEAVAAAREGHGPVRVLPEQPRLADELPVLEVYGHQAVMHLAAVVDYLLDEVGGAVVERLTILGPGGEGLEVFGPFHCGISGHGVGLEVHQDDVRAGVIDFDGLPVRDGETLVGGVGGEGDIASSGVPGGIDSLEFGAYRGYVQEFDVISVNEHCAAALAPGVQYHMLRVAVVESVAVHAAPRIGLGGDDVRLLVGGQFTLGDGDGVPALVAGVDEAVDDIGVYGVLGPVHREGLVRDALLVSLVPGLDADPLHTVAHFALLGEFPAVGHAERQ